MHDFVEKKAIEAPNCAIGAVFRRFYAQQTGDPDGHRLYTATDLHMLSRTKAVARFDQTQASTDGGVVLLKALDDCLQLTVKLAACLPDRRGLPPTKLVLGTAAAETCCAMRIFGLACGYERSATTRLGLD